MIESAERYLDAFVDAGATSISVHVEALPHLQRAVAHLRQRGVRPGVALNPSTPASRARGDPPRARLRARHVGEPGFAGQKFLPSSLDKIRRLRETIRSRGLATRIQVDGGVHAGNIRTVVEAGAEIIVAGAAAFAGGDPEAAVRGPGRGREVSASPPEAPGGEGGGHRRGRLHRLPRGGEPARGRPRGRRDRLLHRLLPARRQGGEPRAASGEHAGFRLVESAAAGRRPRPAPRRRRPTSTTSRPRPGCAPPGAATSPTTPTTTCSPRSACSRRRSARGGRRVVYASSSSVYGDAPALPAPRGRALPPGLALRGDQARGRAPGRALPPQPRPADGEPALLHRLRPAPAPRHGLPPLLEGGARRRAGHGVRRRQQTRDFTYVDDIVAARCGPPRFPADPGSVYNVGGGERVALNEVLRLDRDGHRAAPPHPAPGGPEGRHARHLRRHDRRPPRPRLPFDASASPRASPASGSGSGGCVESASARSVLALGPRRVLRPPASISRPSRAPPTRSSGRPARRPWRRRTGSPRASTSGGSSTPSPRASTSPTPGSPLADSYFEEGGTGNYVLAVSAYREFLTLYPAAPAVGLRPVPGGRVLLQADEQPRPGPDGHRSRRSRSTSGCSTSTRSRPYVEQARERIQRVPPDPRPGALPRRLLLPEDPQVLALGDRPLRDDLSPTTPTTSGSTRSSSGWASASATPAATPRPGRSSPGCRTSSRRARSRRRRRSSRRRFPPPGVPASAPAAAAPGPPAEARPAGPRAQPAPRPAAPLTSSVTLRIRAKTS